MKTLFFFRFISALTGLLVISAFASANAATDSLGTFKQQDMSDKYDTYGFAYGNNTYVSTGEYYATPSADAKNFAATSVDGKAWTVRATGSTSSAFNSVIFSNGRFISVCKMPETGTGARIYVSDNNGTSWTAKDSDSSGNTVAGGLHAVASDGSGRLIAVGGKKWGGGWITVSNGNGNTWTVKKNDVAESLYGVGYSKGVWLAFSTAKTYRSTDAGTTWNPIASSPIIYALPGYKMAANETTIVVASNTGPKWSTDLGLTWKSGSKATGFESLSLTGESTSVVYADGTFVLTTRSNGDVWISETGRYWKRWKLPALKSTTATYNRNETHGLCYGKKAFWASGWWGRIDKSPSWFKARNGCSSDYPYTVFDTEDGPPNRIGLPQYRVNTASLNLVLESTLFYTKTLAAPLNFKLVYNSKPCADGDTSIGPFGKNWRFRYESAVGRFGQEAKVMNGGGRGHTFATPNGEDLETVTSDVTLQAPDGIFDTLKYIYNGGNSRFELTLKTSHLTYVYGTPGTVGSDKEGLFFLKEIKDQFGRKIDFIIDPNNGNITSISNAGRIFSFYYASFDDNKSKRCYQIDMPDGRSVKFHYDNSNNLTEITDMMGYHGTYEYDENGFLTSMSTAGKTNTFTYLDRPGYNEPDTVENKGDKYLSALTRPGGKKIKYELQDEGETIKRTDAAGQVTLFKNKDGQTTAITDPLGNVRTISYNGAKLPEAVTDEKGGVFTYEYDDKGNMTQKKDAENNITKYTYDADNNTTSVTNALDEKWEYTYNGSFQPTSIKTPKGHTTTIGYFSNNLHDVTDPRGNTTLFTFDAYGNLTSVSAPSTTFSYDAKGLRCTSITDANGNVKNIAWDNNDRITTVSYPSAGGVSYTNKYDAFGQTNFTDELGQETSIVRDELGYITSITDPLGYITQTEYDADSRPIKKTDALGRITTTTYDKDGHPLILTDSKGYKIIRSYDDAGNLISFKDKNSAETTFTYDKNNRLLKTSDPLKKVTEITRDAIGRVSTSKNARGQTITYTYDHDGRISGKTGGSADLSYVRDGNGNITSQTDAWGTTEFTYDSLNRITKIVYPDLKEVSLAWNNSGQLLSITYPYTNINRKLVVTYTSYDSFNRIPVPSLIKNNPGTELFGESRSTNAITEVKVTIGLNDSSSCKLAYNSRAQLTELTRISGTDTPCTNSTYSYDKGGRITQIQHTGTGTMSDVAFTAKYAYDPVSNLTSETFSGSTYFQDTTLPEKMANLFNLGGQLTNRAGSVCTNDADGNITSVNGNDFKCTYDAENRLTKIEMKKNDGTIETTDNLEQLRRNQIIR